MSHSSYRDYCNEEFVSPSSQSRGKRPVISNPIPIQSSSSWTAAIPYADGGSPSPGSRENVSMVPYSNGPNENYNSQPTLERVGSNMATGQLSSPTDTVNTVIHNGSDRVSNGSLTRRSVGNFEPLIRPEEPTSPPPADVHEDEICVEHNSESQRLMGQHLSATENVSREIKGDTSKTLNRAASRAATYDPGTCCYCLSNMTCANLFLWISMVVALIAWSVSIWRSVDSLEFISQLNVRTGYSMDGFPFTDITIIVIATATLLFSIVFLIVSSYTSHALSSYHLPSSQTNKCAYCFTIAMGVFSCIAVVLWTLIVAVTMIPTTAVIIIHLLFNSENCVHLPSYGLASRDVDVSDGGENAGLQLSCGDDLNTWLADSWNLMTPLLISLGCAILIEIILMGYIIVISSNGRHLYERKGYLMSSKIVRTDSDKEQQQPFI